MGDETSKKDDKRLAPRFVYRASALLFRGKNAFPISVQDVSGGGIGARSPFTPALRQFLYMEVVDPTDAQRPISLSGMAVRSRTLVTEHEVGIQLYGNSPEDLARWSRLVGLAKGKNERRRMRRRRMTTSPAVTAHSYERFGAVLTVRVPNATELVNLYHRAVESGTISMPTQTDPVPGSEVLLKIVHPDHGGSFELIGMVTKTQQLPAFNQVTCQLIDLTEPKRQQFLLFASSTLTIDPGSSGG